MGGAEEVNKWCTKLVDSATKYTEKEYNELKAADKHRDINDDWVFYKKMMADYWRYRHEVLEADETDAGKEALAKCKEECGKCYGDAWKQAKLTLEPTNPTRLGCALNYSVCHYEVLK